jgi:hypothetical protein
MQTLYEALTAPSWAEEATSVPAGMTSWQLTAAIHQLRLTVADASLRAREEARQHSRASREHWASLGRAYGFHEATGILRAWTHPTQHDAVLARLAGAIQSATEALAGVPGAHPRHVQICAFHAARAWVLRWVMSQVGELSAHACSLS